MSPPSKNEKVRKLVLFSESCNSHPKEKAKNCFHHYFHCRTSQSTHTCPTTTEITQPRKRPLPTPPTQKTVQPLSQHASSCSLGHMNMNRFFVRCFPCSCKKTNRLLNLTFDFHTPKLRISSKSIFPTTIRMIPTNSDSHVRYSIKIQTSPFRNRLFPHQKSCQTRSSVPLSTTLGRCQFPLSMPETTSFSTPLLESFADIFLHHVLVFVRIMHFIGQFASFFQRMFLSISVQCLVFSNSRIIVGSKESASHWSCPQG